MEGVSAAPQSDVLDNIYGFWRYVSVISVNLIGGHKKLKKCP